MEGSITQYVHRDENATEKSYKILQYGKFWGQNIKILNVSIMQCTQFKHSKRDISCLVYFDPVVS